MVSPLHTPGVYTTPVAFTSAVALDWFICIVEVSDSQKQSINDAFQYVVAPWRPCCSYGNIANLQNKNEKQQKLYFFFKNMEKKCAAKVLRWNEKNEKSL